jgi:hypothetical protein
MSMIASLLGTVKEKTGVICIGLERKIAKMAHTPGETVKDILGWDVVVRAQDGGCYEYYVAQPPLIGMSHPQPVRCPLGIVPFDDYKIDIDEAIQIFHSLEGHDGFMEVSLSWPLIYPDASEPYWYFRTLNGIVIIGAISGQIKGFPNFRLLYMGAHH